MPERSANAAWNGNLKEGNGTMKFGSGAFEGQYSFSSRFENGAGTNPEELIAAAHAGCFSMAFANGLSQAGFEPESVATTAKATLEKGDDGFKISTIHLETVANVPNIENEKFQELAKTAKDNCPVSKALAGTTIRLSAKLE